MKLHPAGNYLAKIYDFGLWKSKKGPMALVVFEFKKPDGGTDRISWFGSFNGGAKDITVETLVRLGFNGKTGEELQRASGSGVLDQTKELEIVIDHQPNPNKNNELEARVKFINLPGGSAFREKISEGEAKILMAGLNLEGDFALARQRLGVAPKSPTHIELDEEDLPF